MKKSTAAATRGLETLRILGMGDPRQIGKWTAVLDYAGLKEGKRRRAKYVIRLAARYGVDSGEFRSGLYSPDDAEIIQALATVPDHLWPTKELDNDNG
jgi:hypothetical protein